MKKVIVTFLLSIVSIGLFAVSNITPGATWNDASGKQINAHGGCVVYDNSFYYWFGEDRTGSVCNGISCYKSADLYNWTKLGLALTPTGSKRDDMNDIAPGRTLERPKVIYNTSTNKWVMWIHWENGEGYGEARVCVATSDNIDGPYTFYKTFRPNNHDSRDQTIFRDNDGKAYHFCSTDMNSNINLSLLRDDYLEPTTTETKILRSMQYEAPAIFRLGDIYYGLFSGCTGWDPNPGRSAYATSILGGWTTGMNFAVDELKDFSYKSQSTYVLKVEGYEKAFIYMGDRWNSSNVGASQYVWCPLSMRSGYPTVRWYDKWDVSVFENMYRYKRAKEIVSGNVYSLLEKCSNRLMSKPVNGFAIANDDDAINLHFTFIATENPYAFKLKDNKTGNYLTSLFGTLRLSTESSSIAQQWLFVLQQDGYFKIMNMYDGKYLSVSGSSTYNNTSLYLNTLSSKVPQDFAIYFDSRNQNYEEADIFSTAYIDNNLKLIEEQNTYTSENILEINAESYFTLYPTVNKGDFSVKSELLTGTVEVQVVEAGSGKLVYSQSVNFDGSYVSFDLFNVLSAGMYLVSIKSDVGTVVKKMMVIK
ncbi:MAG: family 43 glycosylhydrolase [Bacteroidales bacterium]|nr:family 43 glycosylhydrolase [Bacteroidales bacterium]